MNRHEGVSCDCCLKGNFHGRRFKCLVCYDYDLCSSCYEAGTTTTRHSVDHAMQCILTKADFSLYYGGEALPNSDQPQSYTCPLCGRMGFTEATLHEHVTADHAATSLEVVCPICAVMPGGDPNLMTDDFAGHLTLEHRTGPRELISFLDETFTPRARRPPGRGSVRGRISQDPPRRPISNSSNALASLSLSSWDSIDPIAELLSQLSSVRRTTNNTTTSNGSAPSQLQQLEMQLQLERQQAYTTILQRGRLCRRQLQNQTSKEPANTEASNVQPLALKPSLTLPEIPTQPSPPSCFLLRKLLEDYSLQSTSESRRSECSSFVQQMILSTILPRRGELKILQSSSSPCSTNATSS